MMEPVYYTNKEFEEILQKVEELVDESEHSPFTHTKELVTSLLQYFDLMHREPLARLMKMIEKSHPELRNKMKSDYTIETLFRLYDLMEGAVERTSSANKNIPGFVPVEDVKIITPTALSDQKIQYI